MDTDKAGYVVVPNTTVTDAYGRHHNVYGTALWWVDLPVGSLVVLHYPDGSNEKVIVGEHGEMYDAEQRTAREGMETP